MHDAVPLPRPTLDTLSEHPDLVWDLSGPECLALLANAELVAQLLRSRFTAFRLEEEIRRAESLGRPFLPA
jgi:hypothetical protein